MGLDLNFVNLSKVWINALQESPLMFHILTFREAIDNEFY